MATGPAASVKHEIEFTAGTWTDVSTYQIGETEVVGTFGRATSFDDIGPSTWTVSLRNEDGRFTATNTSGAYYPNVICGKRLRVTVTSPASVAYQRFLGYITSWTVHFPDGDVHGCRATITASDVLATVGRRTLDRPFVEEANRRARAAGEGCDVFPLVVTDVNIDQASAAAVTYLENKGTLKAGNSALGDLSILRALMTWPGQPGQLQQVAADNVLNCDGLEFTDVPNTVGGWTGPVLRYNPQGTIQRLEFFLRVPKDLILPLGDAFERTIADAANVASSVQLFDVRLFEYDGAILGLKLNVVGTPYEPQDGSGNFLGDVADGVWRKVAVYKDGASTVCIDVNDGQYTQPGCPIPADMTTCDNIVFGGARDGFIVGPGNQDRCMSSALAGIIVQTSNIQVPKAYSLGAPPAVSDSTRFDELAGYLATPTLTTGLDGSTATNVARTTTTGRTLLECMQEIGRTCIGYVYVDSSGVVRLARANASFRTSSQFTVTLDLDDDEPGSQQWVDSVDVNPTRVTVTFPGGTATAVNAAAEAAGAYHDAQLATAAVDQSSAVTIATAYLGSGAALWPSQLVVDLAHAQTNLWAAVMAMPPGTRMTLAGLPTGVFGASSVDLIVSGWRESHTQRSNRFTFDLVPA